MKALVILIALLLTAYVGWSIAGRSERKAVISLVKSHGVRLLLLIGAALLLAVVFYALPAIPVLN